MCNLNHRGGAPGSVVRSAGCATPQHGRATEVPGRRRGASCPNYVPRIGSPSARSPCRAWAGAVARHRSESAFSHSRPPGSPVELRAECRVGLRLGLRTLARGGIPLGICRQWLRILEPCSFRREFTRATWLSTVRRSSVTRHFTIQHGAADGLVRQAHTIWMCVDRQSTRAIRIPETWLQDFAPQSSGQLG